VDETIRLYAYYQKIPISQVIRATIQKWLTDNSITYWNMLDLVVKKLLKDWDRTQMVTPTMKRSDWLLEHRDFMERRIPESVVNEVLEEVEKRIKE